LFEALVAASGLWTTAPPIGILSRHDGTRGAASRAPRDIARNVRASMRDIFQDIFQPAPDPVESARRAVQPARRKRFYDKAAVGEEGGFAVLLDGKPVRTPARRALAAPTHALAQAIVGEWQAQGEFIEPAAMPLTRLANSIIDGVADAPDAVAVDIVNYLACDLLLYRADSPPGLVARQAGHWDPLLAWGRDELGAVFQPAQGVMHVAQPAAALAAARAAIPADAWRLGALHAVTTLTGSALIALALLRGRLSVEQAWQAAHVDEDWNMDQWGRDEIALARRAARFAELQAAATVLAFAAD
jgi:chaperone required for assembly of F1-ATPase